MQIASNSRKKVMYLIVFITWVNLMVKIVCELLKNESDALEQTDL